MVRSDVIDPMSGIKVFLEESAIVVGFDGAVNNTVVCKETSCTVDYPIRKLIYFTIATIFTIDNEVSYDLRCR